VVAALIADKDAAIVYLFGRYAISDDGHYVVGYPCNPATTNVTCSSSSADLGTKKDAPMNDGSTFDFHSKVKSDRLTLDRFVVSSECVMRILRRVSSKTESARQQSGLR